MEKEISSKIGLDDNVNYVNFRVLLLYYYFLQYFPQHMLLILMLKNCDYITGESAELF